MENHTKYSRNVIPGIEESLSKIAAKVTENSLVLDVGCSSGMMGRYLALEKGCIVDGIDIDEIALENCKPVYRKIAIKNLELDDLTDVLVKESYDFIIVADVIEHLNNPERLLAQLKLLVKPYGAIIFSVPNITHIAASLELLLGNFDYRQYGLLDSTHIRFYSYANLLAKLNNSGLYIWETDAVHKDLGETEFGNEQSKLFPQKWLDTLIAVRPDSLVYQWIVATKIYPRLDQVESHPATKIFTATPVFTTALYWEDSAGAGFNETNKLIGINTSEIENELAIDFNFQLLPGQKISKIRIDPVSEKKLVWIKSAKISNDQNVTLWEWTGKEGHSDLISAKWVETQINNGKILSAENDDPQWYPEIPEEILQKITSGSKCSIVMCDDGRVIGSVLTDALSIQKLAASQVVATLNQAVTERDGQIVNLNQAITERDAYHQQTLSHILSSTSWRLTRPLRFIVTHWKKLFHIMKLIPSAIKHSKGIKHPVIKAVRIYQHEGMDGVRRALSSLRAPIPARPSDSAKTSAKVPDSKLVNSRTNFNQTCPEFVEYQRNPPINPLVKLIAFYLPQFHPFPENDEWWGKGFTEWTNVGKALPNYIGHYQPHCPIHSGYYDLRVPEVMEGQAKLAKEYGIYGFSYYFYWFGGVILMDIPLELMLTNKKVDIPFCLTWANENWSRRWDGQENDVLIAQNHSDEDSLAFIRHLVKYFKDERYIRIDGKPVLIIYRANIIPNMAATAKIWREEVLKHGLPGLYLVSAQTFGIYSPKEFDFDASVEFPPHNVRSTDITHKVELVNPQYDGHIYSYDEWATNAELIKEPDYKLYRTAMLSWDNTARKQNNSHIFHDFSLRRYKQWLTSIVNKVSSNQKYTTDEKIVFVNAWNEWAEGTHLEPDQKVGYGYLQTTYDVLRESTDQSHKIIVVTHDAFSSGAQFLALNMAKELAQGFGFKVEIVCLGGGVLMDQYAQYGPLHDLTGLEHRGPEANDLVRKLAADGHRFAIVNTTVSGFFLETLKAHGIKCISLVHELRGVIDQCNLNEQAKTIARLADKVVFPAQQVADEFEKVAPIREDIRVIRPQGQYKKNPRVRDRVGARRELREALQLPQDALIVLAVGYAYHRKGVDLFVDAGKILVGRMPNVYLVWVGHWDINMQAQIEQALAKDTKSRANIIFPGYRDDTDVFFAGADAYALTSREDPFPAVVLMAMDAALPVVGFAGIGGCSDLLEAGCGKLVPAFDVDAFASALEVILKDRNLAARLGKTGQTLIHERFSFRNYLFDLLKQIGYPLPRVSVVVPNYNYAHLLPDRIKTIESQKFPIYELIILDDGSTDTSVHVIEGIIQNSALDIKFVRNDTNSGSVFAQWQKGVELATGDLVWIAEADDLSEPNFISDVLRGFDNPDVVLSYCESKQITLDGKVLCDNYLDYVADISRERWLKPYVHDGHNEIVDALSVKNTIPNVSAVVFRRGILSEVLKREQDKVCEFKIAGDWYIYTKLLEHGGIAFIPNSLNLHRRHDKSVTNSSLNLSQLAEIVRMQRLIATSQFIPDTMQETARCYAQKLYEQLGLASREFPNYGQVIGGNN